MLALFRQLMRFFKREHQLVTRYERSHPHFFWFLGIDAVVSVALIAGVFYALTSNSLTSQNLVHVGNVAMSAEEFVTHLKENHVSAYWLGPMPGSQYSINHMTPGVTEVFYTPQGSNLSRLKEFTYKITKYQDASAYARDVQPLVEGIEERLIPINSDRSMVINEKSMKSELVTFNDQPLILMVTYSRVQSLKTLIRNAQLLKRVL